MSIISNVRREIQAWNTAFLESIPGELGCVIRARFYGFKCGKHCRVLSGTRIFHPSFLVLGNNVGIAHGVQINAGGGVVIDDDVLIGPAVKIWSQNHRIDDLERKIRLQGYTRQEVHIRENCWIGANAVILPGVTLAPGTVIASGAIMTRSALVENQVYAGVPAKVIRQRGRST